MEQNKKEKKIEYLVSLFFNTGRLIKEKTLSTKKIEAVSMLQIEALRLIEMETPTMKRVAEFLKIKAPSATSLVNGLVRKNFVKRVRDETDHRIVKLKILSDGHKYMKEGIDQMTEKIKQVLLKLSQEKIDNFIQIMEEIKTAYQNEKNTK